MARELFGPEVVVVPADTPPTAELGVGQAFTAWSDRTGGTDYTADLRTPDGITTLSPVADSNGMIPWFRGPDGVKVVYIDAGGGTRFPLFSVESLSAVLTSIGLSKLATTGLLDIVDVNGLDASLTQISQTSVKTVNNQPPDSSGNVTVAGGNGGGAGTVTAVAGNLPDGTGNVTLDTTDINGLSAQFTSFTTSIATKADDLEIADAEIKNAASATRRLISGRRLRSAMIAFRVESGQPWRVKHTGSAWPALSTVPADFLAAGGGIDWDSSLVAAAVAPPEMRDDIDVWTKQGTL